MSTFKDTVALMLKGVVYICLVSWAIFGLILFFYAHPSSHRRGSPFSSCAMESEQNGRMVAQFEPIWEDMPDSLKQELSISEVFIEKQIVYSHIKKRNMLVIVRSKPYPVSGSFYTPVPYGMNIISRRTRCNSMTNSFDLKDTKDQYDTVSVKFSYSGESELPFVIVKFKSLGL